MNHLLLSMNIIVMNYMDGELFLIKKTLSIARIYILGFSAALSEIIALLAVSGGTKANLILLSVPYCTARWRCI